MLTDREVRIIIFFPFKFDLITFYFILIFYGVEKFNFLTV